MGDLAADETPVVSAFTHTVPKKIGLYSIKKRGISKEDSNSRHNKISKR